MKNIAGETGITLCIMEESGQGCGVTARDENNVSNRKRGREGVAYYEMAGFSFVRT